MIRGKTKTGREGHIIDLVRQGDDYIDERLLNAQERLVGTQFWSTLRRHLRHIPFARDLVSAYYAAADPETPAVVRAMLIGALSYFIVPTDMMPDFIVGFGFTDDATVLAATLQMVLSYIRPEHQRRADAFFAGEQLNEGADDPASEQVQEGTG